MKQQFDLVNDKLQMQLKLAQKANDDLKMQCESMAKQIETFKTMIDELVATHEVIIHYHGKAKPKGLFKRHHD